MTSGPSLNANSQGALECRCNSTTFSSAAMWVRPRPTPSSGWVWSKGRETPIPARVRPIGVSFSGPGSSNCCGSWTQPKRKVSPQHRRGFGLAGLNAIQEVALLALRSARPAPKWCRHRLKCGITRPAICHRARSSVLPVAPACRSPSFFIWAGQTPEPEQPVSPSTTPFP